MKADWIEVEIAELCELNPRLKNKESISAELEVQFLPMALVEEVANKIHLTETRKFSEVQQKNYTYFAEGDVLFAKVTPCMENGKIAIAKGLKNQIGFGSSEFHVLRPSKAIHESFLFYFLVRSKFRNEAQHEMTGAVGLRRVPKQFLENYHIPLPPLPEQRAIVARIEELFSELDHAVSNLKSAKAKLEIYRQAVLKKAFEGGFTEEFRSENSLPEEWRVFKLEEIVDNLSQGWSPKCINQASIDPNEWAVIKTSAIQHGKFIEEENKILPKELVPRSQHEIKIGDILITRAGPRERVGVCCEVKKVRPRLINCDKVYRIRLKKSVNLSFFMLKMNSAEFINKIESIKTGGNDSGVNLTQNRLLDLEIELPEIREQIQIVQEMESRLSVADKLAETIQTNLQKSEALRQSILKKAFEGSLLREVEVEACRKEADWEPAERLLERIKSEKSKVKK
ncbi:restriction endonuclease subunit S [Algoriphagus sp. AK58]|uniref:restriction endonuclease subunit S n=1 Tax=Algoriphagus sp. AK58 TaxID=1406877 RepID=UPI00164EEA5D|nr:restriction endonuclease subunit S [Algoriphagus sp. AK58]MBC6365773.1 type I restriction endonuclease subunit S [Algoriphagus sp. AK58]